MREGTRRLTYKTAGVDLQAVRRVKERIKVLAEATYTPGVLGGVGYFGASYQLTGYRDPVLVSSVDGVGTKLMVAAQVGKLSSLGQDLVHHCVNDIFTCGARPLFFLDYIAAGRLDPGQVEELVEGLARACRGVECPLVGGETAQMPGLYVEGSFDLVGFIVGVAEREELVDGSRVQAGDPLIALPSSGLHTNGYSLVRQVFRPEEQPQVLDRYIAELGRTLGEALLEPHRCYLRELWPLRSVLKGMAHITGGGLEENLPRTLPEGLAAHVHRGSWQVPPLFRLIQREGKIEEEEMFRVFNMGVGMVVICDPSDEEKLMQALPGAWRLGQVVPQGGDSRRLIMD